MRRLLNLLAVFAAVAVASAGARAGAREPPWVPIGSIAANNTGTTLAFTGLGGYSTIFLKCSGIQLATSGAYPELQLGTGASPTWDAAGYYYTQKYEGTGGANALTYGNNLSVFYLSYNGLNNGSSYAWSAEIWIEAANISGIYHSAHAEARYADTTPNYVSVRETGIDTNSTGVITGVRLLTSSGNIAAGTCSAFYMAP